MLYRAAFYSYEAYVTNRYKESLKREGRTEQLADVDIISALDLLCSQGQYSRCLEMAVPHGDQVLHKYVGLYAAQLLKVKLPKYFQYLVSSRKRTREINFLLVCRKINV